MFENVKKSTAKATTIILIIFLITISFVHGMDSNVINLLNSLADSEAEPTNLFVKSCWPLHVRMEFMKKATVQVVFIDDFMYQLPVDLSPNNVMFFTNLDCDWADDFAKGINVNQTFFKHPYRWIMHGSSATNTTMIEQINNALPDSNIILAKWNNEDNYFDLSQCTKQNHATIMFDELKIITVYKTEPFGETIYEPFGYWFAKTGLVDFRKTKVLSQRRRDLRGHVLRGSLVILNNDSINHLTDYRDKNIDSVSKLSYILINYMLDATNSSKSFSFTNTWGYLDEKTNKINGMLGAVLYKETDIGCTPCFLTVERMGVYEFIAMLTPTTVRFIFRAPTLSFVTNIYYMPFQANVWFSLVALVVISCFVNYITIHFSNVRSPTVEVLRPSDIALFGISSICQMGTHREPKYLSGKISTIFFVVALIFVYTSYTANIVSLLQSTTKSIKTLDDLYNSDLQFGVEDTPYNKNYFQLSRPGTVQRAIYEQKIVPPKRESKFMNLSYGISQMRKGFFAFHCECGTAYKIIEDTFYEHEKCGLIEIDYLAQVDPWVAIQKHSPYKEIMKVKMREHGIQFREVSRIYTKRPICSSHGQSFESVRLIDCQIVLMILAYGFLFSFIIFIIEKIVHARAIDTKLCLL